MKCSVILLAGACVLLAACSPKSRAIPRFDDTDGAMEAAQTLSPWPDGSPDQSHDQRTPGQDGSDRQLFGKWFIRYAEHEQYTQHDANYRPFPVPSSIGDAIKDEQRYEVEDAARERRRAEKEAADSRAAEAARLAEIAEHDRQQAAADAAKLAHDNQRNQEVELCLTEWKAANETYNKEMTQEHGMAINATLKDRDACLERVRAKYPEDAWMIHS